eukprot:577294-Pleurochrysis_carterae.AAC.1
MEASPAEDPAQVCRNVAAEEQGPASRNGTGAPAGGKPADHPRSALRGIGDGARPPRRGPSGGADKGSACSRGYSHIRELGAGRTARRSGA